MRYLDLPSRPYMPFRDGNRTPCLCLILAQRLGLPRRDLLEPNFILTQLPSASHPANQLGLSTCYTSHQNQSLIHFHIALELTLASQLSLASHLCPCKLSTMLADQL